MNIIRVVITGENSSLRGALRSSAAEVKTFGSQVATTAADTSVKTNFIGKAFLTMSAVIIAAFAASAVGAVQLEQRLRNVATISPYVRDNINAVGDSLVRMSIQLPQSANTLAEGLYDVASSGFAGKEGLDVLEASAKAASAGLTDTATSARVITGVLNAYGLTARDAADVSDVLFQTVNLGVITYEELAQSLGQVMGIASAAKVPLTDLGAAYATITLGGIGAAEASTALKRVIQSFIDPSQELNDVLLELGYSSGEQAIKQDGLRVVLTRVREAVGGSTQAFTMLFPEIRAATGALALTNNEGRTWARVAKQMEDATDGAGATQRALAQQQQSLGYQIELTKNRIVALGLSLGRALLPALKVINGALQDTIGFFDGLPGPVQTGIVVLAGISAVLLALGGAFLLLIPRIVATRAALESLGPAGQRITMFLSMGAKIAATAASIGIAALSIGQIGKSTEATTAGLIGLTIAGAQLGSVIPGVGTALGAAGGFLVGFAKDAATSTSAAEDFREVLKELLLIATSARSAKKVGENFLEHQFGLPGKPDADYRQLPVFKAIRGVYDEVDDIGTQLTALAKKTPAAAQKVVDGFKQLRTETGKPLFDKAAIDVLEDAVDKGAKSFHKLAEAKRRETEVNQLVASGELTTKQAIAQVTAEAEDGTGAINSLTKAQQNLQKSLQEATDPGDAYGAAVKKRSDAIKSSLDAQADAEKKATGAVSEGTQARIDALGRESDAWYDFSEAAKQSLGSFIEELKKQNQATFDWQVNLARIAERGGREFAEQLRKMGPEAAPLVAEIATSAEPQFAEVQRQFKIQGALAGDAATQGLDEALNKPGMGSLHNWSQGLSSISALGKQAFNEVTVAASDFYLKASEVGQAINDGNVGAQEAVGTLGTLAASFYDTALQSGLSAEAATKYTLKLFDIPEERATDVHNTGDLARIIVEKYLAEISLIPPSTNTDINATDYASEKILSVYRLLAELDGKAASVYINQQIQAINPADPNYYGQANGGIVKHFARGGHENHVAQFAKAGTWRVWAEPETGGEAYIPLGRSKRARSLKVLNATADMFGLAVVPKSRRAFADSGMWGGAGAIMPSSVVSSLVVRTEVNFNAPFYGDDHLKKELTSAFEKHDRELSMSLRANRGAD